MVNLKTRVKHTLDKVLHSSKLHMGQKQKYKNTDLYTTVVGKM